MDSRFPTSGPGKMEMCRECVIQHQREADHLRYRSEIANKIADELENHPEILNGNTLLHDLLKLRRGQRENT